MDTFRRTSRKLSTQQVLALEALKCDAEDLEAVILAQCTDLRMRALAMTKLEECVMWAVKGITA